MRKKTGIFVLILTAVILALAIYTAAAGWGATGTGAARNIKTGLDLSGGVSITYETSDATPSASDMADTIYKLQRRVDSYSTEANVYQEGLNRITVEIPGVTDADEILRDLGTPGSLYFIAETDNDGNKNYGIGSTGYYELNYTLEELAAKGSIVCEGSEVASATGQAQTSQTTGATEYVVALEFTGEGRDKFAEATTKAYASGETIGIYYDGAFVSVPRVQSAITDGHAIIQGMESIEVANQLASFIRIGGLKLELHELQSKVVGAQLGIDAIRTSLIGGGIGIVIVMLIMIIAYLVPGTIAAVVLALYTALMLLLLNAFDLTLTLPGIAGIVLSIGMAVDANVIIFARIKEELQAGASVSGAIRSGFHKAMSAIIDGNVTTLIAAAVLGFMGSGPIKGFAMTLALGVVLSMFTALVVARILVNAVYAAGVKDRKYWARTGRGKMLSFVRRRKLFFIISLCVILLGPAAMAINGGAGKGALNLSLDFVGGTNTTVDFAEDYSMERLEKEVKPVVAEVTGSEANISMLKTAGSNQVVIKTRDLNADERLALGDKLEETFGVTEGSVLSESISATISSEMRRDAVIAVIISIILMLLYIWIRFKDIRFASSAVIALAHDVLVVFAAYAIVRISVGSSFIACMLTILGYSINATIVIFDRIRENLRNGGSKPDLEKLVDTSISQTLTRSILTSVTTFASIAALYVVGVPSIREFALPLMVGIVAGAWSSVCITGPLWHLMKAGKLGAQKTAPEAEEKAGGNPNVIRKKKK